MVVVSIQARMSSTRLPGKVLLPLGDRRVLSHVVNRCRAATTEAELVVTTGEKAPNDAIREWCCRSSVRCVSGPEDDLLERHRQVLTAADDDVLVRITGDCPFVPPSEITRLLEVHAAGDAALTTNNTDRMPTGTAVDVLKREALEELAQDGATHPVAPLRKPDSPWKVRVTDSERWAKLSNAHTAVDTSSDYWALIDAVEERGNDPYEITALLAEKRVD